MWATSTYLAIASLTLSAAGSAVSYSSAQSAAKSQASIATANASNERLAQSQRFQLSQLETASRVRETQQQAALRQVTAGNLDEAAKRSDDLARRNATAKRAEHDRAMGAVRARIAGSGIVEAGTPLDVLAEAAGNIQLGLVSDFYEGQGEGIKLRHEAGIERAGAQLLQSRAALERAGGSFAKAANTSAQSQINLNRLAGLNQAANTRRQAGAQLLSDAGSLAGSTYELHQAGAFKSV